MKSKGFGDTVARFTAFFGIDKLVYKITKLMGKEDCGCTRRKDKLNKLIPYRNNEKETSNLE